jgi:hypothetical protein
MQAQTITFGYSDSEDRIWARLVLDSSQEVRFWITRRLLQNLIHSLSQLLEQQTALNQTHLDTTEIHQYLKTECFEASRATWDPTPPPPLQLNQDLATTPSIEMCLEINIQIDPTWHFQFSGPTQKNCRLSLERHLVPKFLIALTHQAATAGWQIPTPSNWLALQ